MSNHFGSKFRLTFLLTAITLLPLLALSTLLLNLSTNVAEAVNIPTVRFDRNTYVVDEGAGTLNIEVRVSSVPTLTAQTITVTYRTVEGSARAGIDYVNRVGELVFAPGDNNVKLIPITIINNTIADPDKTFNVVLQEPINATLTDPSVTVVTILNNDPTPTPTNTPGAAATPIYSDIYEPNNTLQTATTLDVNSVLFCNNPNATLWPTGDVDFYRFWAKGGSTYVVKTDKLSPGLDTGLTLYGPQGQQLAQNDDFAGRASQITFVAMEDGYHYASVINKDASDPANKVYCVQITETTPTVTPTFTPHPSHTPVPSPTRVPGADVCEPNNSFEQSCTIGAGQRATYNFVPYEGTGTDNDFFRLWVKPGLLITCETDNLSSVNDTNMIIYDQHYNGLMGNDDKTPGDFGSKVTYLATYTGWLYILVGPVSIPTYAESYLYTYDLVCTTEPATPTPPPTATFPPFTGGGTGGGVAATSTPTPTPTDDAPALPTPDIEMTIQALLPTTPTPPSISIMPLPTSTPVVAQVQTSELTVILYYDANDDRIPQMNEGIQDMAVSVYDGVSGQLLSFGYTNEAGMLRFTVQPTSTLLRIAVPFLGFNQTTTAVTSEVTLRVAPRPAGAP